GALEEFGKDFGTLEFDDMRLRFQISATDGDQLYVILRRLAGQIGELESLRISPKAINIFSQFTKLRSGMIIVLGGTAQGKTTLAAHIYKRMVGTTGGRAITIQDPVEYATQGPIGT
ncbi:ATPase, T2SS/T4P/T4SS family, partial [Enterobacter hormaechei]|uniref:ATPase, T2SS/T4P/T4SS family n=1 Tax=Enterobacter hormaechei TaxID=158836 RepID=UPI0013D7C898